VGRRRQRHFGAAVDAINRGRAAANAPGATVAAVLAGADIASARSELDAAIAAIPRKVDLRDPRFFRPNRVTLEVDVPAARRNLDFGTPPATPAALRAALLAARNQISAHQWGTRRRDAVRAIRRRTDEIITSARLAAPPAPPP
jgi:hypothetical protein